MSDHVVEGDDPKVLDRLAEPAVMGVVLRGAFTVSGLQSAGRMVESMKTIARGLYPPPLPNILLEPDDGMQDFAENFRLLNRFLERVKPLGSQRRDDVSRIELARDHMRASNGIWHVDSRCLVALGVPVGPTTEYQTAPIPGFFVPDGSGDFTPDDETAAARSARPLPQDALLVMKSSHRQSATSEEWRGVVHRRPNEQIERGNGNRMVVQLLL